MNLCIRYSVVSALASALLVLTLGLLVRYMLQHDDSGGMAMILIFGFAALAKAFSLRWYELFHFPHVPSNDIERATQMAQSILFGLAVNAAIVGAIFGYIWGRYRTRSLANASRQAS